MRVGLISDTHGLLRPGALEQLADAELILHAGDVGDPGILVELGALAPVHAVWGNTDGFDVRAVTAERVRLELEGWQVLLTHGHELGSPRPDSLRDAYPDADIIVFGHTHAPLAEAFRGALMVNPGAAGPARFRLRPSIALLELAPGAREVRHIEL